jgi:hypothetical protein
LVAGETTLACGADGAGAPDFAAAVPESRIFTDVPSEGASSGSASEEGDDEAVVCDLQSDPWNILAKLPACSRCEVLPGLEETGVPSGCTRALAVTFI